MDDDDEAGPNHPKPIISAPSDGDELIFTCIDNNDGPPVDIQPAPRQREWMNATGNAVAYRCLPLVMANQHGWEIRTAAAVEAEWDGGSGVAAVSIWPDDPAIQSGHSHFGSGILTFSTFSILRVPKGCNLWLMPPANRFKDGIQGMSALIEADWIPYTFSVNWKFTRPGVRIRFEAGEPICMVFPVARGLVEAMHPERRNLDDDEALRRQFRTGFLKRNAYKLSQEVGQDPDSASMHQGWYTRGTTPDETEKIADHQVGLKLKPFPKSGSD